MLGEFPVAEDALAEKRTQRYEILRLTEVVKPGEAGGFADGKF